MSALRTALICILVAASLVLWFADQSSNPPGFHVDESSIALNALTIARSGTDEHGVRYPLFFRAFGEYKSPAYIYLLAAVFEAVDPSTLAARRLSAVLGWLAAAAMGLLAWLMTRHRGVAAAAFTLAIATPALFEISRLAFEVALFPLAVSLFLLASWQAARSARWSPLLIGSLAVTLSLISYTYTAGRLLGPVLAVLLTLLARRRRDLAAVWALYALIAVGPSLAYHLRHDGALTRRAGDTSITAVIAERPMSGIALAVENVQSVLFPWEMALRGDPVGQHHVRGGGGSLLFATFLLAPLGLAAGWDGRWSLFLLLGSAAAVAPAMLSSSVQHSLRYAAWPLFLIAMAVPALAAPRLRRIVAVAAVLAVAQASWFYAAFHRADREKEFSAGVPTVVAAALAQPARPIYVRHLPDYAHTLWYGLSRGASMNDFVRLPKGVDPPPNALSVDGRKPDADCTVLAKWRGFAAYRCP